MAAIRVRTIIPESREITLTLPPDVPVGDAEVEVVVRPASEPVREFVVTLPPDDRPRTYPSRPSRPELAAEFDAFEAMLPELMKTSAGKYVALHDGAVVATGETEIDALTTAHRLRPGKPIYVRLVTDQPQPLERLGGLRQIGRG